MSASSAGISPPLVATRGSLEPPPRAHDKVRDVAPKLRACARRVISRFFKASSLRRRLGEGRFTGKYASWTGARHASTGYDNPVILERVSRALLEVTSGRAAYERDSVTFERPDFAFPLLAALFRVAALHEGRLNVLDFGGSLGSTYHQSRSLLAGLSSLRWSIVEQPAFVELGRARFQNEHLRFFRTVGECLEHEQPHVAILSGVLQYLEDPYDLLVRIAATSISHLVVDRTPFLDTADDVVTVQNVHPEIYPASYPARLFGTTCLRVALEKDWRIVAEFDALDGRTDSWAGTIVSRGMILDRRR